MTDADDAHDAETREDTHDSEPAHEPDTGAAVGHDVDEGRTTAPMSEFTAREAGIGLLVLAVGLAVAFAIPLLAV